MFGLFEDKKVKQARKYFERRKNALLNVITNNSDLDFNILVAEVAKSSALVTSTLYPSAPIDLEDVSQEKIELVEKFLHYYNTYKHDKLKDVVNNLEEKEKKNYNLEPILRNKILNKAWSDKKKHQLLESFNKSLNNYFMIHKNVKFNSYKGDCKLASPLIYNSCVFLSIDSLKIKLHHVMLMAINLETLDWNHLYILLSLLDDYEDYKNNLLNIT